MCYKCDKCPKDILANKDAPLVNSVILYFFMINYVIILERQFASMRSPTASKHNSHHTTIKEIRRHYLKKNNCNNLSIETKAEIPLG